MVKAQILRKRGRRTGFTLIEIMISMVILSIGIIGVFAMQIIAIQTNMYTRDTAEGVVVAEHFAEVLRQDAMSWDLQGLAATNELSQASALLDTWLVPFTEPVTATGVPKSSVPAGTLGRERAKYCLAFRLDWAINGQVLQGWVRVFWPKPGTSVSVLNLCGTGPGDVTLANVKDKTGTINVYTLPITIRRPVVQR